MSDKVINPIDNPEWWTLCRPGHCGCMYADCERLRMSGGGGGYFEYEESGVLGINDDERHARSGPSQLRGEPKK